MPNRSHSQTSHERSSARSSSRAMSNARDEVFGMLMEDHKRVKKLFRDFERLDAHEDAERCESLVKEACSMLELHTTLEEELFYPEARNCLGDEMIVDEAEVEHEVAKQLIQQLKNMDAEDEKFSAMFTVLGEYVKHHIKEEESELFPQLNRAKLDWQDLQEQMQERRQDLMQKMMPEMAEKEGSQSSQSASGRSSGSGSEKSEEGGSRSRRGKESSDTSEEE